MRFVRGLVLGLGLGSVGAFAADVARPYSALSAFVLLTVSGLLALRSPQRPRPGTRPGRGRTPARPPGTPGFSSGRVLGDALEWATRQHGVTTLERIEVTDDEVELTVAGPTVLTTITVRADPSAPGGFTARVEPAAADPASGPFPPVRFSPRDVGPHALSRVLDRARLQHPDTWGGDQDLVTVVDVPTGLRDEVTLRVQGDWGDVLWATASGDLLYVQQDAL
ncbi:hypothetical protein ASG41_11590 [Modestobacter sp. Leaf380]|nr:hypothetical protein ASG41_11590 [Modestobacter sp. Leaf380]